MIVTFAGYDIKVGTPVVSRDGAEVGSVDSTIGEDLVVTIPAAGAQLLLTESGVAAFEPDFIRLEKTAVDIASGNWDRVGGQPEPVVETPAPVQEPEPVHVPEPVHEAEAEPEFAAAAPELEPVAEDTTAAPVGLLSTPQEETVTAADETVAETAVADDAPAEVAADVEAGQADVDGDDGQAAPQTADEPAPVPAAATAGGQTIHLHAEDLIAAKREVATGVVKVAKKVLVEDKAVDVDVFSEKVVVNRVDLDEDADVDYAFEEGVFEIELKGEEVEVGKRVRRVGQVEVGKERLTTTQRVTGQTRREELEVNEEAYDAARPTGDVYDQVVAQRLTDGQ